MLPPAQATAFFQADLTAVVRGMPGPDLAELLDDVADRESEGHAVVWRFSGSTVRRAFDRGHRPLAGAAHAGPAQDRPDRPDQCGG
ncbi:Helicase conserved C-terminal domain-containing protein [Microbispora rosea]|uniref:Helicase conserved C-terminal domain-containing protein n=1 Tax=Microbispora rosea TaxID=58117 RepID=A0A1N7FJ65_9ACTN|nr:helicase-associated domain-containing protein [Microbispora rosea]GIH50308.1 hypothetical protein Mro03_54870 [Microbispora rosea subsp. rosea]SIS00266.1 Helicase conserved C-terminal domain-containing protein [Microbispora rosea]